MHTISFADVVAGGVDGVSFLHLDRPFEGGRPTDTIWGAPPVELNDWFNNERGPLAGGIITISHAQIFGSAFVYVEKGAPYVLEVEQNFLSLSASVDMLGRIQLNRASGALRLRDIEGEVVLLSGYPYHLYGHWMVDFMPRLEMLRMAGRALSDLRFLLPSDLPNFAREWLALAGIRLDQLVLYEPETELCRCEIALMPTNLRAGGRTLPRMADAARWMTEIACRKPITRDRSLYVSRENWGNITRRLDNFEEVEAVMSDYGFETVYPEKLSIVDQVELFASARIVAGDYGSGLHNTIFSQHGTPVVALRGIALHPGFLQSGLCEIRSQPLSYIFGKTCVDDQGFQHYAINSNHLRQCLDRLTV